MPWPRGDSVAMTSMRVSPAPRRLLHGDARQHPGEPVIEFPGGVIRVCACADRVSATQIGVTSADISRARTTTERWYPVMIVFSMGEFVAADRRGRPAFPGVMGALSQRSPGNGSGLLRALSWRVSFPLRIVHVSENRSKHRRSPRGRMSHIPYREPVEITTKTSCMKPHLFSDVTGASCGSLETGVLRPSHAANQLPHRGPGRLVRACPCDRWLWCATHRAGYPRHAGPQRTATRRIRSCSTAQNTRPGTTTIADRFRAVPHSSERAQSSARSRQIVRVRGFA